MALGGNLFEFLEGNEFDGVRLVDELGGWLAAAESFRGRQIICYHKNWAYFSARFQIACAMYVEPKPGIPASPRHVREVIDFIRSDNIPVLFSANYFSRAQVERVASRTGAVAVIVPEHVAGEDGVDDYFTLVDTWVSRLSAGFEGREAGSD